MEENKRVAIRLVSVLATILVLAGISLLFPLVSVAGDMVSEIRPVGAFHSVDFRGRGDLHITHTTTGRGKGSPGKIRDLRGQRPARD